MCVCFSRPGLTLLILLSLHVMNNPNNILFFIRRLRIRPSRIVETWRHSCPKLMLIPTFCSKLFLMPRASFIPSKPPSVRLWPSWVVQSELWRRWRGIKTESENDLWKSWDLCFKLEWRACRMRTVTVGNRYWLSLKKRVHCVVNTSIKFKSWRVIFGCTVGFGLSWRRRPRVAAAVASASRTPKAKAPSPLLKIHGSRRLNLNRFLNHQVRNLRCLQRWATWCWVYWTGNITYIITDTHTHYLLFLSAQSSKRHIL